MKSILLMLFVVLSVNAYSGWTPSPGNNVGVINPGVVAPGKGTLISLVGVTMSGCDRSDGAILVSSNENYSEIYSLLLAARMSEKKIRIYTAGCNNNFPIIQQIQLP